MMGRSPSFSPRTHQPCAARSCRGATGRGSTGRQLVPSDSADLIHRDLIHRQCPQQRHGRQRRRGQPQKLQPRQIGPVSTGGPNKGPSAKAPRRKLRGLTTAPTRVRLVGSMHSGSWHRPPARSGVSMPPGRGSSIRPKPSSFDGRYTRTARQATRYGICHERSRT